MNRIDFLKKLAETNPLMQEAVELKEDIKAIDNQRDSLYNQQIILQKKLYCFYDIFLLDKENSPLLEGVWDLCLNKDNCFYLSYYGDKYFNTLNHLYEDDYHCHHEIINGKFLLSYNDGDITISANDEYDLFKDLIEPLNLKYNNLAIKEISNLNKEIDNLTINRDTLIQKVNENTNRL